MNYVQRVLLIFNALNATINVFLNNGASAVIFFK